MPDLYSTWLPACDQSHLRTQLCTQNLTGSRQEKMGLPLRADMLMSANQCARYQGVSYNEIRKLTNMLIVLISTR